MVVLRKETSWGTSLTLSGHIINGGDTLSIGAPLMARVSVVSCELCIYRLRLQLILRYEIDWSAIHECSKRLRRVARHDGGEKADLRLH